MKGFSPFGNQVSLAVLQVQAGLNTFPYLHTPAGAGGSITCNLPAYFTICGNLILCCVGCGLYFKIPHILKYLILKTRDISNLPSNYN
jgi:hypothetical protein